MPHPKIEPMLLRLFVMPHTTLYMENVSKHKYSSDPPHWDGNIKT